jgi:hypothetical protein
MKLRSFSNHQRGIFGNIRQRRRTERRREIDDRVPPRADVRRGRRRRPRHRRTLNRTSRNIGARANRKGHRTRAGLPVRGGQIPSYRNRDTATHSRRKDGHLRPIHPLEPGHPTLRRHRPASLWQLNAQADRPDMAVILEADPDVISERLIERGPHNRFQLSPDSSHAENYFYRQATERLIQAGFDVLRVDCNQRAPQQVAAQILDHLTIFSHPRRSEHAAHRFPTTQIRRIDRRRNLHRRAGHAQHWREWTVSLSVHATLYDQQKAAASGPEQTRRNLLDLTASL